MLGELLQKMADKAPTDWIHETTRMALVFVPLHSILLIAATALYLTQDSKASSRLVPVAEKWMGQSVTLHPLMRQVLEVLVSKTRMQQQEYLLQCCFLPWIRGT